MNFLHISDLHLHGSNRKNGKVLEMLDNLYLNYPDDYLIVTGDLTDDGSIKQYKNAYKALEKFMGRVFICPGNHDYGAVGNFYSKRRARHFDSYLAQPLQQGGSFYGNNEPVINVIGDKNNRVMLIALDSNLETEHIFDFACGKIGKSQLTYLEAVLSDPSSIHMKKIVFFHHHPFIVNDNAMRLKDAKKLMRMLYGRVDVLMFGHKHKSNSWKNTSGIKHILASNNSPGRTKSVRRISIETNTIKVSSIKV